MYSGFKTIEDKEAFERKLREPLREEHILGQFTKTKKMPKNNGKYMSFRKATRITPSGKVLEEGNLPDPRAFGIVEYRSTLARYGDYIKYTDESTEFPIDDLHAAIVTEMGYSFKDFLEAMRYKLMCTTKNKWYAGEASSTAFDSTTKRGVQLGDLPKISAFFRRNNVQTAKDNAYVFIIPPEALIPLQSLAKTSGTGAEYTYVEIAKDMKSAEVIYKGAEGKLFNFVFIVSNSIPVVSGVAHCLVLGKVKGEWGTEEVSLEGANLPELINKPLGSAGTNDPLNQHGTIGWKVHGWGGLITYEEAVIDYAIKLDDSYEAWDDTNRQSVDTSKTDVTDSTAPVGTVVSTNVKTVTNGVKSST